MLWEEKKKNQKLQENKKRNLPGKPFPLPYILPKVSKADGNLVIGQPTLLRTRNKIKFVPRPLTTLTNPSRDIHQHSIHYAPDQCLCHMNNLPFGPIRVAT